MTYIKYPRTFHLPWSMGITKKDKVLDDAKHFRNKRVIITPKFDGENTTLYKTFSFEFQGRYPGIIKLDIPVNFVFMLLNERFRIGIVHGCNDSYVFKLYFSLFQLIKSPPKIFRCTASEPLNQD